MIDLDKVKAEILAAARQFKHQDQTTSQKVSSSHFDLENETAGLSPLMPVRLLAQKDCVDLTSGANFHYRQFAKYEDRHFVRNAYIAMLGHAPDPQGERHYVKKIRSDMTRAEILVRLRYSGEGRTRAVKLRGIFLPATLAFIYKIPIFGTMLRWQLGLLAAPSQMHNLIRRLTELEDRQIQNEVLLQERMNEAFTIINILQRNRRNS